MNKEEFIKEWNLLRDCNKGSVRTIYTICGNEFEADWFNADEGEALLYLHEYPSGRLKFDTIRKMM